MTAQQVKDRVDALRAESEYGGDCESMHESEDSLHVEVLQAIADGQCEDAKACAAEAIKTKDVVFTRWYA